MVDTLKGPEGGLQVGETVIHGLSLKGNEYIVTSEGRFFEVLATKPARGQDKIRGGITLRPVDLTIDVDPTRRIR